MVTASSSRLATALRLFLIFILSLPLISLFIFLPNFKFSFDLAEVFWATKNSVKLAFFSSLGAFVLAVMMTPGLLWLRGKNFRAGETVAQLMTAPVLLPAFFIILTCLDWIPAFPFTIFGAAIIHSFYYAGFLAISLADAVTTEGQSLSEAALVMGASRWQFLRALVKPITRQVAQPLLAVFMFCFSSFSIPLIVAGAQGTTLEVLIYEQLKLNGASGSVLLLALLQFVMIGAVFFFFGRTQSTKTNQITRSTNLFLLSMKWFLVFNLLYVLFTFWPWLKALSFGMGELEANLGADGLLQIGWQSLSLAFSVFIGVFLILALASYARMPWNTEKNLSESILRSFWPLSTAVIGLGLSLWTDHVEAPKLIYILALIALFTPSLFRFGFETSLKDLNQQLQVALLLGASREQSWRKIIWPQLRSLMLRLSGLAFLWTFGDFALARFFLPSESTLALLVDGLMTSYRFNEAFFVGALILISGIVFQLILWGGTSVTDKKS
jgi:thiamine transport system permease protein